MRTKILFAATLLVCCLFAGLFAGCDFPEASGELNGRWFAYGFSSIEFNNGRFKRTNSGREILQGTYVTEETNGQKYITFFSQGNTTEKHPYDIDFPMLTIGDITYYHDSPSVPKSFDGTWYGFFSINSSLNRWPARAILLGPMKPQKGNHFVLEGKYQITGYEKGDYYLAAFNMPGSGVFVTMDTHVFGGDLHWFIRNRMPVHLMILFDWEALEHSINQQEHWWFTPEEARKFFIDAAQKAGGDLAIEQQIMNVWNMYMNSIGRTTVYEYGIIKYDEPIYDLFGDEIKGNEVLTLRSQDGAVVTFINANISEVMQLHHEKLVQDCKCRFILKDNLVSCVCLDTEGSNAY